MSAICFVVGFLLLVMCAWAAAWWVLEGMAQEWYEKHAMGYEGGQARPMNKPWYVLAYDRRRAKQSGRW